MIKKAIFGTSLALSALLPMASSPLMAEPIASVKKIVTDTVITTKVKGLYAKSPALKGQNISVNTFHHKVHLQGLVKTNHQYERAIVLAESVDGVRSVNVDDLKVKASKAPLADSYITAKVKSRFMKEKLFGSKDIQVWPIKVETKDAVVYLSGKVSTEAERMNALNIAHKVNGIKAINSSIVVK